LDFDQARYLFDEGYWVKIEVKRVPAGPERPHGRSYSLTLPDVKGRRILGIDNAHAPPRTGAYRTRAVEHDHWHRTERDGGRPYVFRSALQLVQDFLDAVEVALRARGVSAVMSERKDQAE
jgi:hypothetical protein